MAEKCETVVIADRAYNAMIRESFARHPVETGGILLGYILDNGIWVVMEMIPPGINGIFRTAYFEYDRDFVNYLGTCVANQYRKPLQVLGLWHRHPGSMDRFSPTDDGTNAEFASKNPYGVISGLVNIDPAFRLTMYHLDHDDCRNPHNIAYSTVDVEVGDDLIPEKFFALRYVDKEHTDLHPRPTKPHTLTAEAREMPEFSQNVNKKEEEAGNKNTCNDPAETSVRSGRKNARKFILPCAAILIFLGGLSVGICSAPSFRLKGKVTEAVPTAGTGGVCAADAGKDSVFLTKQNDTSHAGDRH